MAESLANLNKGKASVIYSDTEIIIGKVLKNGVEKDVYRRTIDGVTISTNGSWHHPLNDTGGWGIDELFALTGNIKFPANNIFVPTPYNDQTNHIWMQFYHDRLYVNATITGNGYVYTFIVDYTKV